MTESTRENSPDPFIAAFVARPRWQRVAFRAWRKFRSFTALTERDRKTRRCVIPPREWSQESADAAIKLGQEKAKEYGW